MKLLLSTRKHDPVAIGSLAVEMGFDGIEYVMPSRIDVEDSVTWSLEGLEAQVIHARVDDYNHDRFTSALYDALTVADFLGSSIINIHPPSADPSFGGRQNVLAGIELLQYLASQYQKIKFCYELLALPTKEHHYRQKAYESFDAWLADVAQFNLPATLDTTHAFSWGVDPAVAVQQLGQHLHHVHLSDYRAGGGKSKDEQHLFPGEGDIDWNAFFFALKQLKRKNICITFEPAGKFDLLGKDKGRLRKSLKFVQRQLKKAQLDSK